MSRLIPSSLSTGDFLKRESTVLHEIIRSLYSSVCYRDKLFFEKVTEKSVSSRWGGGVV